MTLIECFIVLLVSVGFGVLTARRQERCNKQHYKVAGAPMPKNMQIIVYFAEKEKYIKYAIAQCTVCNKKFFSCHGRQFLNEATAARIDEFIHGKISREEFGAFLEQRMEYIKWSDKNDS